MTWTYTYYQAVNNLKQDPASLKLLALSWLTLDQTIISGFPPDHAKNRWGLVAPRQTAKPPEDLVSEGGLHFMLTGVMMDQLTEL